MNLNLLKLFHDFLLLNKESPSNAGAMNNSRAFERDSVVNYEEMYQIMLILSVFN